MKVLIFGPSGSGKTYTAHVLRQLGINAFDDPDIEGLSNWYDQKGRKVTEPATADEALDNHYAFLWSVEAMAGFLEKFTNVYVFGGSGNVASVFHLFDKIYFLKVDPETQKERLLSRSRPTPLLDANDDGLVIWGGWFAEFARKQNIPFVDASQTPEQIFEIISSWWLKLADQWSIKECPFVQGILLGVRFIFTTVFQLSKYWLGFYAVFSDIGKN